MRRPLSTKRLRALADQMTKGMDHSRRESAIRLLVQAADEIERLREHIGYISNADQGAHW